MAGADLAQGRWVEAMDHLSEAKLEAREADASELYLRAGPGWQLVEGTLALQGPASARSQLAEMLDVFPLSAVGARAGARVTAARLAAVVGDSADARRIFGAYEESFAPEERGRSFRVDRETQRALEAFGAGRWDEAADAFHRLYRELKPCGEMCVLMPEWGVALDEAGRDAEALDVYRMALEDTQLSYHLYRAMWIAPMLERVGRIHEEQGDTTEARGAYQRIVDQFGGGDGPFRAFADRAQRRLAALQ
jgi:tetratricopeptide (TPR) repeat protein